MLIIFTIGNEDTKCRITASIIINRHSLFNNRRITSTSRRTIAFIHDLTFNITFIIAKIHRRHLNATGIEYVHFKFAIIIELQCQRKKSSKNILNFARLIQASHRTRTIHYDKYSCTMRTQINVFLFLQPNDVTLKTIFCFAENYFCRRTCINKNNNYINFYKYIF